MSEIYYVLTERGCFEPFITTPYHEIVPEHRTPRTFSPPRVEQYFQFEWPRKRATDPAMRSPEEKGV